MSLNYKIKKYIPWKVQHWMAKTMPYAYNLFVKGTLNPNTQKYLNDYWRNQTYETYEKEEKDIKKVIRPVIELISPNSKILDIGCGIGYLLVKIKEKRKCEIYGLDLSEIAIKKAKEKGIPAIVARLPDLPFVSSHFDVVMAIEVLEYIFHHRKTLSAIKEILRSGGKFIATVPNNNLYPDSVYGHVRYFTRDSLYKLLSRYFVNIQIREIPMATKDNSYLLAIGTKK